MQNDLANCKSLLVQVMALCCQSTRNGLSQCGPSSLSIYGTIRSQWVKTLIHNDAVNIFPSQGYCFYSLNYNWFRQWLVAWSAPSHYLNQSSDIVNWNPRNKLKWHFTLNSYIFIHDNPIKTVIWKMLAILSRPHCVEWVERDMDCITHSVWAPIAFSGIHYACSP